MFIHITSSGILIFITHLINNFFNTGREDLLRKHSQLVQDVVPEHYFIELNVNLQEQKKYLQIPYSGFVEIEMQFQRPTPTLRLHSNRLLLSNIRLSRSSDEQLLDINWSQPGLHEDIVTINLLQQVEVGIKYKLKISYNSNINKYRDLVQDYGLLFTNQTDTKGVDRRLAATVSQPAAAAFMFPCFNDPALKANFTLQITHNNTLTLLSNMPIKESKALKDKEVLDEFQMSPPMPTYAVGFLVGDFSYKDVPLEGTDVKMKIWALPEKIEQTTYIMKESLRYLKFYEKFFDIPYPLPKLDVVVVPDLNTERMEIWGLIALNQTKVLLDEKTAGVDQKQLVSMIIAHELALQWVGSLVTAKSWDEVWLQEALASYMSAIALQKEHPEWNSFYSEIQDAMELVLQEDSKTLSQPLSTETASDPEARKLFFEPFIPLSYKKGMSLLHMVHSVLGEKGFKDGVNHYLKTFAYKNVDQSDLWEAIGDKSEITPKYVRLMEVMESWTLQAGYPVLNVTSRKYDTVIVTQSRFISVKSKVQIEPQCWWIPVTTYIASNPTEPFSVWLNCKETTNIKTKAKKRDWIILNYKASGLYRVNYDPVTWQLLIDALHGPGRSAIDELDRARLISDSMALARIGWLNYATAINLLTFVKDETSYVPWSAAFEQISDMDFKLRGGTGYSTFKKFVVKLLSNILPRYLTTDVPQTPSDLTLQSSVLKWACRLNVTECTDFALGLFNGWKDKGTIVPKHLQEVVCCEGVKSITNTDENWKFVWDKFNENPDERELFINALACSQSSQNLETLMIASKRKTQSREFAIDAFFAVAKKSDFGFKYATDFLLNNFILIRNYMSILILPYYIVFICQHLSSKQQLNQLKNKVSQVELLASDDQVLQALQTADDNVLWEKSSLTHVINAMESTLKTKSDVMLGIKKAYSAFGTSVTTLLEFLTSIVGFNICNWSK